MRNLKLFSQKALALLWVLTLANSSYLFAAEYPATILADTPLAYYRFEETSGTTAIDSSSTGLFPGIYNLSENSLFPEQGQPGITTNSIVLSASTPSVVTAGYYSEFNQQSPFSFEIWVRPTSYSADYRSPIGNFSGWGAPVVSGWYVYQTPNAGGNFVLATPGGIWISSPTYSLLNWYHLAGTYDGTAMRFYVNGALAGSQAADSYTPNGYTPLALGHRGDGIYPFDGGLDEFAYYTVALSPAQILNHYQVGATSFRVAAVPPSILTDVASVSAYAGHGVNFKVIADGTAALVYQWYKGTSRLDGATNSTLNFVCTPSDNDTAYRVVITNSVGSITSSVANLSVSTGLQINAPLTSILRNVGSMAAFEVVAEGALPISYQWHKGDSTPIQGATNATLWLTNVTLAADNSTYYVSVINPYTSINSDPATLNVQARPVTAPVSGYAKVVVADGPVALWQLNETTEGAAVDTVGSFDGTYVSGNGSFGFGAQTGIPHDSGRALGIAGGATISIPYAIEINPTESFSVEGWFQPASTAANGNDYRTALSSMSNPYGAGPTGWLLYQTGGNNWSWWPYNGFWTGVQLTDPDSIIARQWYYIAMTFDGKTFTLYVNGAAKASGTDTGFVQNGNVPAGGATSYNYNYNTTPGLPVGSGPMTLGWRNPADFNPFTGTMDNVAVYNKALTPQQIQNHFLNTTHLTFTRTAENLVILWPTGTLQSSTEVNGVYEDVPGASSPYTTSLSGAKRFYRIKLQ